MMLCQCRRGEDEDNDLETVVPFFEDFVEDSNSKIQQEVDQRHKNTTASSSTQSSNGSDDDFRHRQSLLPSLSSQERAILQARPRPAIISIPSSPKLQDRMKPFIS